MRKGTRRIKLTQGKFAIVDSVDYEWLIQWKWYASDQGDNWYAKTNSRDSFGKRMFMHREIAKRAGFKNPHYCDHRNHNGLDNQRRNIRPCTNAQNQANARKIITKTSRLKGVSWDSIRKKWRAVICPNRTYVMIGRFSKEKCAHNAYAKAARKYFGEFAHF